MGGPPGGESGTGDARAARPGGRPAGRKVREAELAVAAAGDAAQRERAGRDRRPAGERQHAEVVERERRGVDRLVEAKSDRVARLEVEEERADLEHRVGDDAD